jgi:hypothetical protein
MAGTRLAPVRRLQLGFGLQRGVMSVKSTATAGVQAVDAKGGKIE